MDCVCVVIILFGVKKVLVVYCWNKCNMLVDEEEFYLVLEDGVDFLELFLLIKYEN